MDPFYKIIDSSYKIKTDFDDKNAQLMMQKGIKGLAEIEQNMNINRNSVRIEPIYTDSVLNNNTLPPHPKRESMKGYKRLSFASLVD